MKLVRTGVAHLDLPFFGGSHQTAAPQLRLPKRADASRCRSASALVRGGCFFGAQMPRLGASHMNAIRRAECAAPGLGPAAPNETRVRGAGPARKTFVAPHHGRARIPCSRLLGRGELSRVGQ